METKNGSTAAPLGVLAEINQRLAAITSEQFTAPQGACAKGDHPVAYATDEVKRLYTLWGSLIDEGNAINNKVRQGTEAALKDIFVKGPEKTVEELKTPGSPTAETRVRLDALHAESERLGRLLGIVKDLFWEEVQRQHPELAAKPTIAICSDWSLVWREDDQEKDDDLLKLMFSIGGDADSIAHDIVKMLGERRDN